MSDGIDQKPECEHAWAHKSTSVGLWVPQCYLCGELNNADLGQQIAKVKADAWDEGYETGCSSPYGTATPSGKSYDPEPNPHRER